MSTNPEVQFLESPKVFRQLHFDGNMFRPQVERRDLGMPADDANKNVMEKGTKMFPEASSEDMLPANSL
jgi:hypothetical protein